MIAYEDFVLKCDSGFCPRHTIYNSKTCLKEYKRKKCWSRYNQKLEKSKTPIDEKWEETRKKVWLRDAGFFPEEAKIKNWKDYCRCWNILTIKEQQYLQTNFSADLWLADTLDCAHAFGRSGDLKYDESHIFLISRFFHSRLDQYRDPVTGKNINEEERNAWFERIRGGENV